MYIYLRIYTYICVCVCVYIYIYIHTYIYTYEYVHTCIYIHVYICNFLLSSRAAIVFTTPTCKPRLIHFPLLFISRWEHNYAYHRLISVSWHGFCCIHNAYVYMQADFFPLLLHLLFISRWEHHCAYQMLSF